MHRDCSVACIPEFSSLGRLLLDFSGLGGLWRCAYKKTECIVNRLARLRLGLLAPGTWIPDNFSHSTLILSAMKEDSSLTLHSKFFAKNRISTVFHCTLQVDKIPVFIRTQMAVE